MTSGPSKTYLDDRRIDKLEAKVENVVKAIEAINAVIADVRERDAARHSPYIGAGR